MIEIKTLGALKQSSYKSQTVKEELRKNLILKLNAKEPIFEGIHGYDSTVLPDVERAILSKHSILLLGLRGQAKTKIARLMVNLLDEYVPIVAGSELNDDPLNPISNFAQNLIDEKGDDTPIEWLSREERYVEKLATPDVSVADLIGDVDPIKAANLRLDYSDERVIHYGLVPRANRCIFVINELPDLQARIQVSLFNILQEGDIQIRGFKLRLPLDISFVFTANPEDYTNRGSIITPLKDRISSQILTHYPFDIEISKTITRQEAKLSDFQRDNIVLPEVFRELLEQVSVQARDHEFVDDKSGVSVRLGVSAMENLYSAAERRIILNGEDKGIVRLGDFWGIIPAITGKLELTYEGEQEGAYQVAIDLLNGGLLSVFDDVFPNPDEDSKEDPYGIMRAWFSDNNLLKLPTDLGQNDFEKNLSKVAGLQKIVETYVGKKESFSYMEILLHGLAEYNVLNKDYLENSFEFKDILADMFNDDMFEDLDN